LPEAQGGSWAVLSRRQVEARALVEIVYSLSECFEDLAKPQSYKMLAKNTGLACKELQHSGGEHGLLDELADWI
jgi:hypothetical protein